MSGIPHFKTMSVIPHFSKNDECYTPQNDEWYTPLLQKVITYFIHSVESIKNRCLLNDPSAIILLYNITTIASYI